MYNAKLAIEYLVVEANVYNEWAEAAMWQAVSHIVRASHKNPDKLWTAEELNHMIDAAEQE